MKKTLQLILGLLFLVGLNASFAQTSKVTGKVTSADDGSGLPGVSVLVKGTTKGTQTDYNGAYSIEVASNQTLVFTFIGMQQQEVLVGAKSMIDVALQNDDNQLEQLVVIGYGTQSRKDLTGSISTIAGKSIAKAPVQSFDQALQGRAAGVNITTPNGVLNNPPVIFIRGVNSINMSSYPLIVIDGIPAFTGNNGASQASNNPLSNINPEDIQSIEVLKDASASAIYGSRASGGVILITTKRGSSGKSKFNFDSWVGVTQPFRLIDVLNADEYMTIKNEGVKNLNENTLIRTGKAGTNVEGFKPMSINGETVDTDWYDYVYRTGFSYNNAMSFSGGTDKTSYYFSLGNTKQKGMLVNNDFSRTNARINVDHKVFKNFTVGVTFGYSNNFNSAPNSGSFGSGFSIAGLGRLPLVLPPNVPALLADGSYNLAGAGIGPGANLNPATGGQLVTGYYNPAPILDLNRFSSEGNEVQGSVFANLNLLKGLNLRTQFGLNNMSLEDQIFYAGIAGDGFSSTGSASNYYRTNKRWNWQNTAQYDITLADNHNLSLLVGGEQQHSTFDRWGANRTILADAFFTTFQGNFTNIVPDGNGQGENYLLSYFSRFNYNFGRKYFASVNFRRDGYSAWAQKWGNFYGLSLGYIVSEEAFWKNSPLLSKINFFKVTGSYGEVGNSQGVGDFASLQSYSSGLNINAATLYYSGAGNTALSWETSKKTDVGFTFGALDDKLTGEFAYYKNLVDGLIMSVPQSPSKGIPGNSILANVGSMQNTGVELSLTYSAIAKKDFTWKITGNITTQKNEVLALTGSEGERIGTATSGLETSNYTTVGRSVGEILAVPTLGVNPENGRRLAKKKDGTIVQYDHLGTGWTTLEGKTVTAPSQLADGEFYGPVLPKWYGGLDNNFTYKAFDLGIFTQFSGGNYIYNGTKAGLRDQRFWNNHTDILNRWTPTNKEGTVPRIVYGDNVSNGSALVISENVEKGDFLRIRNIALGYAFNKSLLNKIKVSNLRLYGQVQNALLLTKYTGIDPEISSNGQSNTGMGIDRNSVGQARTYTIGLNVGF
ncbi:SusC/RagA family TonB-linked outer membrane protein [Lacihabitans sp. CCS-44]|uniref:SusC/RagA family TonB-linked outer membrane protein n=1 Tax=Lacihabitans sp. CCS-44 TaxID=2487331 RepID=UPI0020CDBF2B|nr:SusC/RagA family TonB-linked outer membrane protein [Lacihabitans sp. CCS-44]MCP9757640.1 SusC/RagA family TonB-linked outer membrane protein [Lacihabitans sp. CCS-44]